MDIVLATRNKNKIAELQMLFDKAALDISVLSLEDIGYTDDIEEDGTSFKENAIIKASVPASMGYIGVADDSGLCVDALNGAPGIYSARYSGEHGNDIDNNNLLLKNMENVHESERGARFVSVIACVIPENINLDIQSDDIDDEGSVFAQELLSTDCSVISSCGNVCGSILYEPIGDGGFGYDPIFYVSELKKSYAQLTIDEKNLVSHRGKAFKQFIEIIKKVIL